jgi:carboxymethylenebutenolidase
LAGHAVLKYYIFMSSMMSVPTVKGNVSAYLARPGGVCRAGVIVIHEVWGLADHIKDVANRLASEGYLALAPDFLGDYVDVATLGGLQEDLFNPEKRNAAQPRLRELMAPIHNPEFAGDTADKLSSCFDYLYNLPESQQKVATIGFCFGGSYGFTLAVREPRLKLALPFYGHADFSAGKLSAINCPVRAFYGEKDENLIKALPDLKAKMAEAGVDFQTKVYPDCGHAFFNDTNKFAYNESAALDAWQLVLKNLKTYAG